MNLWIFDEGEVNQLQRHFFKCKDYKIGASDETCSFNAELGFNVFVCVCVSGALDFLEKPTVAFVRLKEAQVLKMSLEASAPVRFIFMLIGSARNDVDYHETGRAMSALLADQVGIIPNGSPVE